MLNARTTHTAVKKAECIRVCARFSRLLLLHGVLLLLANRVYKCTVVVGGGGYGVDHRLEVSIMARWYVDILVELMYTHTHTRARAYPASTGQFQSFGDHQMSS